ncbi:MAG: thioether cross-link-forming SCIFF peptide maturase [Eubacteriales bacterium]
MIHTFSALGQRLVADVNSGAVHLLDEISYDILRQHPKKLTAKIDPSIKSLPYAPEALEETWKELFALQEAGLLFSSDDYLDVEGSMELPKSAVVKALCLHVSHDCNLRCKYCFAATGDFGTGRKVMTLDTAKKAIDFVIAKSGTRHNIEVDFFGGEPLMAMDVVTETVKYARGLEKKHDKCFRFTITTNGVLLDDDTIQYINKEMSNIVLSLDGRETVNDAMRKTVNGKGSYEGIVPKFQKLVNARDPEKDYYVRGTFTRDNLDFAKDVLHLADLGFRHVSVEPASGPEEDKFAIKEADLPQVMAEYESLAEILLQRDDVNFFHFNVDLAQGPCVIKRLRGCGAGCEYVAITPDGEIYPCHQFVGKEDYLLGNIEENSFDMDISTKFSDLNIYTREDCGDCWAKFYCSGGCSASNLLVNHSLSKPNFVACEMERKRLECAIAMLAIRAQEGAATSKT